MGIARCIKIVHYTSPDNNREAFCAQ